VVGVILAEGPKTPKLPSIPAAKAPPEIPAPPVVKEVQKFPAAAAIKAPPAAPAAGTGSAAQGVPKTAVEPRVDTSRIKDVHVGEDVNLGPGRKIDDGKGGVSNQNTISGPPSKGSKPATGTSQPGGIEVSVDPSARPNPTDLKKGKPIDGLPGQEGLDSRLTDRVGDPKGRLKDAGEALLTDPKGGGSASSGDVQPGDTRYGSKESLIGGGVVDDTVKGAKAYKGEVTGTADNTPGGSAIRQANEESDFLSADRKTSTDGTVIVDTLPNKTVRVRDENNGTTTTLYPDGSTQTVDNKTGNVIDKTDKLVDKKSTSIPDSDSQGAPLPAEIQKQVDADLAAARKQLHVGSARQPGGTNPNNTDPAPDGDETTGAAAGAVDKAARLPDKMGLIGNPGSADATSPARPSVNQEGPPKGTDPTYTDPAPDGP
jgi:hypothetical protein